MNKIFFLDMDGTAVDRNSKARPASIEVFKEARAKGHKVAIATGRPYADIVRDLNEEDYDYLIANNGAYFYNVSTKEFTDQAEVSKETAFKVLEKAKANGSLFAVHADRKAHRIIFDDNYSVETDVNNDPNFDKFHWSTEEEIRETMNKYAISQASIRDSEENIIRIKKELSGEINDAALHVANGIYLDVNPKNISKLLGVKNVLKLEGMTIEQSVAFGDSGNDLQMIEGVGLGIAMGNGTDQLKAIADEVIGDNNSDAIADKIRELI